MSLLFRRGHAPAFLGLFMVFPSLAWGHPEPHPVDADPEVLAWVQTGSVNDWDLRIQSFQGDETITAAQPDVLPICWQQDLRSEIQDLEGNAGLVWLRAWQDGRSSEWVGPRLIAVPEPTRTTQVWLAGSMLLAIAGLQRRSRAARRAARRPRGPATRGVQPPAIAPIT